MILFSVDNKVIRRVSTSSNHAAFFGRFSRDKVLMAVSKITWLELLR